MEKWISVISFTYPHEAYFVKGLLESEGIDVQFKDEMTVQVHNFYSNAIGGIKLLVMSNNYERAYGLLKDKGYIKEISEKSILFEKFDKITSTIPFIGKQFLELRLIILVAIILVIIAIPVVFLSIPSTKNKLIKNDWCVDRIYYRNQVLKPSSLNFNFESKYSNCSEIMYFNENGMVIFPGINDYRKEARWKLRNDSLIIEGINHPNEFTVDDNLEISRIDFNNSLYIGSYSIKFEDDFIKLQSDSVIIVGRIYKFYYNL